MLSAKVEPETLVSTWSNLFFCVSGSANFVQQLYVEVLVVGGPLGHVVLQGGDLLLGCVQTLLQTLVETQLLQPLSFQRLQRSQQLLVAFSCEDGDMEETKTVNKTEMMAVFSFQLS